MANIKIKLRAPGEPGALVVGDTDISEYVQEWPITIEKIEDDPNGYYAVGVKLVGQVEIDVPDAVLRLIEESGQ